MTTDESQWEPNSSEYTDEDWPDSDVTGFEAEDESEQEPETKENDEKD